LTKFAEIRDLGVAGTPFLQTGGYDSSRDSFEGENHVAGGCQLFRRGCFEELGGYVPTKGGGVDWIAVTTARMKGWRTRSFRERRFIHHRPLGTAERSSLLAFYSYGEKDYCFGGSPVWEVCRIAYRMSKPPFVLGGLALGERSRNTDVNTDGDHAGISRRDLAPRNSWGRDFVAAPRNSLRTARPYLRPILIRLRVFPVILQSPRRHTEAAAPKPIPG
jgi:hypothetical protein